MFDKKSEEEDALNQMLSASVTGELEQFLV